MKDRRDGQVCALTEDYAQEILSTRLLARLALYDTTGTIHVTAVWFLYENGELWIPTSARSRKVRNIQADPRATVLIERSLGGLDVQGVMIIGEGSIVGGETARQINKRIHSKYLPARALDAPIIRGMLDGDDVSINLRPQRVVSWDHSKGDVAQFVRERGLGLPLG